MAQVGLGQVVAEAGVHRGLLGVAWWAWFPRMRLIHTSLPVSGLACQWLARRTRYPHVSLVSGSAALSLRLYGPDSGGRGRWPDRARLRPVRCARPRPRPPCRRGGRALRRMSARCRYRVLAQHAPLGHVWGCAISARRGGFSASDAIVGVRVRSRWLRPSVAGPAARVSTAVVKGCPSSSCSFDAGRPSRRSRAFIHGRRVFHQE